MPNLSIKNVPEPILTKLRERARHNHRSLQGELMALITGSVESSAFEPVLSSRNQEPGRVPIERIASEHRERWQDPVAEGPLSRDIIRADRDAR